MRSTPCSFSFASSRSSWLRGCIVPAALALATTAGCSSLRPRGEVVRYMARPPASAVAAPSGGAYALYQDPDDPPLYIVDLGAGDRVGFERVETGGGGRDLYAVAGGEGAIPLEGGKRYSWRRQASAGGAGTPAEGAADPAASAEARAQADAALDAARRDFDRAERDLAAAKRRLESAQERADRYDAATPAPEAR